MTACRSSATFSHFLARSAYAPLTIGDVDLCASRSQVSACKRHSLGSSGMSDLLRKVDLEFAREYDLAESRKPRPEARRLRAAPVFRDGTSGLNHRCRTSWWNARRSSSDSRFHRFPSVDQRLHVKQPFRRLPRLSISISGCLHWLQQAILSASTICAR
jgi:hypothetical protein